MTGLSTIVLVRTPQVGGLESGGLPVLRAEELLSLMSSSAEIVRSTHSSFSKTKVWSDIFYTSN